MSRVIIFDVEHGFCAFVKSPTGCTVMIDCGRKEAFSPVVYVLNNELGGAQMFGGYRLTQLVVSHPHDDHIEDIQSVTSKLPPYLLYRQRYNWEDVKEDPEGDYENLDHYSDWQEAYNAPAPAVNWGMDIKFFSLTPAQAQALNQENWVNNSGVVVVVTVSGTQYREKFVFGADIETDGWAGLLKNPGFRAAVSGVDFYIASHHGHSSGFSTELYGAMGKPFLNLISVTSGDENVDGRYSNQEYARGAVLGGERRYAVTTRADGSIFIDIDAEGKAFVGTYQLEDNELLAGLAALLRR